MTLCAAALVRCHPLRVIVGGRPDSCRHWAADAMLATFGLGCVVVLGGGRVGCCCTRIKSLCARTCACQHAVACCLLSAMQPGLLHHH